MSKTRARRFASLVVAIAALTLSFTPIAGTASAAEITETFVATGNWGATTCDQVGCNFVGVSNNCFEVETGGETFSNACHVILEGRLNFPVSSNACNLAAGVALGNVIGYFYDGSDPGVVVARVGIVAGPTLVAQALAITSASTDLFDGVLTGVYPPTGCPVPQLATTFAVTTTVSPLNP